MTDPPRPAESRPYTTPRWVKVSLIIALVLVLAFVILKLAGVGGEHGPGRHLGLAGGDGRTATSSVTESSGGLVSPLRYP